MKHKKNTKKNKLHKGRKTLLSRRDIEKFVDRKPSKREFIIVTFDDIRK